MRREKVQRRVVVRFVATTDVGPKLEQRTQHMRMVMLCGVINTLAVIWIGAAFEEQPHHRFATGNARKVENRNRPLEIGVRHRGIRVGPSVEKHSYQREPRLVAHIEGILEIGQHCVDYRLRTIGLRCAHRCAAIGCDERRQRLNVTDNGGGVYAELRDRWMCDEQRVCATRLVVAHGLQKMRDVGRQFGFGRQVVHGVES